MKFLNITALLLVASLSVTAHGENKEEKDALAAQLQSVKLAVTDTLGLRIDGIKKTPISDLFEVMTERGIFYTTADAKYIVRGSLFDASNGFEDLTEVSMGKMRLAKMTSYEPSMIVYKAKNEKHQVTVFTDVDCGYCRKMHREMSQYNALGITVRYMAFPRGGEGYPAWTAMQSLWCSDDQHKAMDELKAGTKIAKNYCANKVPEHYQLGVEFGVNATPSIVLDNGSLLVGYRPPQELLNILQ
ncbi:MAG: bifunctional protein-disulfide isomerase/oxidoreductase DsbC [Psychrobium sp.]